MLQSKKTSYDQTFFRNGEVLPEYRSRRNNRFGLLEGGSPLAPEGVVLCSRTRPVPTGTIIRTFGAQRNEKRLLETRAA